MSCSPPKPGFVKQIVAITPYAFHLGIHSNGERSKPIVTSSLRDTRKGRKVICSITGKYCIVNFLMTQVSTNKS